MGAILSQYFQFLKEKCRNSKRKELQHITVIEEAHHLFAANTEQSKAHAEGGTGQSSSQAFVKTLNNMLAEIRAYGEGFVIVDQSPSALHPAVLKNTGVKIIHRIDYGQDIETIRDVLLLEEEDHEIAALTPGQALIRFGGMRTPAKIYIERCLTKEQEAIIPREDISGNSLISHLLEDKLLWKQVAPIVKRFINHLLYDDISNYQEVYSTLCEKFNRELVLLGHSEILEDQNKNETTARYFISFIPEIVEQILPKQYGTAKMVTFFGERLLNLINESGNSLSALEVSAFEDYRKNRIWPRISQYWQHSLVKDIQDVLFILKESRPETELLVQIVKALVENGDDVNEREICFDELMTKAFFLIMPKKKPELFSSVVCLLEYRRKRS